MIMTCATLDTAIAFQRIVFRVKHQGAAVFQPPTKKQRRFQTAAA
jgi:hypothetical protein